jgi:hypothetical protein
MDQITDEKRLEILKEEFLQLSSEKRMEFIDYAQDYLFSNIKNSAYSKVNHLKEEVISGIKDLKKNFQELNKKSEPENQEKKSRFDFLKNWKK